MLACGADIHETNTVRKHLTALSGGRLAVSARCHRVEVLAVSDVPGDAIDVIGSGPCAPDPTTYADALAVLKERDIEMELPSSVRTHLERGARGEVAETPKPGDPRLASVNHTLVATPADACAAAVRAAREAGLLPVSLGEVLRGEASAAGRRLAALGRSLAADEPVCLVANGETTVTLRGSGKGGRSQELALAAALELESSTGISLLAAGTDGTDGPTDAAGAFADGQTVARGAAAGVDAGAALRSNDSHRFYAAEGGLFITGPTGTNVMDLVLVRVAGLPERLL